MGAPIATHPDYFSYRMKRHFLSRGRAMVGRTRLYPSTGSPLISGHTALRRRLWPWIVLALLVVAAAGVWAYLTYLP